MGGSNVYEHRDTNRMKYGVEMAVNVNEYNPKQCRGNSWDLTMVHNGTAYDHGTAHVYQCAVVRCMRNCAHDVVLSVCATGELHRFCRGIDCAGSAPTRTPVDH